MNIKPIIWLIATILMMGSSMVRATPVVLYDNITNVNDIGAQGIGPTIVSSAFSTTSWCPNGCLLGNVTLWMLADTSSLASDFNLELYKNDAGGSAPGSFVTSFTSPQTIESDLGIAVFKPDAVIELGSNTNYWVQLSVAPSSFGGEWGRSSNVGEGNFLIDLNLNFPGSSIFNTSGTNSPFMFKVEAESLGVLAESPVVSSVPVPAAFWLMVTGLMGLIAGGRSNRSS